MWTWPLPPFNITDDFPVFSCISATGSILRESTFPSQKRAFVSSPTVKTHTLYPAFCQNYRPIGLCVILLSFLKLSNDLSPSNFFLILNSLHFFHPTILALKPTTPLKLLYSLRFMVGLFTQQSTNPSCLLLLFLYRLYSI